MASLLELGISTGKWDAGLRKAQSSLNSFIQAQGGLQQAIDKENAKIGQFVRMMGDVESGAKTAKGQMKDYKGTLEQLTMQYNQLTDAQKKTVGPDYLAAIDKLKAKFHEAKNQVDDFNRSIQNIDTSKLSSEGSLFGGSNLDGMLQVFGGNVMTKIAGVGVGFVSELGDMIKQGAELARQGEGIRMAFERLGRGDILDGLRKATHGTVTDLELMKAAVKFNDFKLPLEELGTMLAFAQQKAKDTGQSVDYMVDSIVTGLGRKSLMILDNLGLSAAEIKDKMKETGDMTKAVGAIIREQMQQAGDYVETAADRATKADVELKNAMENLGRTFQPLTDSATDMWTSIKVGAMDLLNNAVKPLINALTEAGRKQAALQRLNGNNAPGQKAIDRLKSYGGDKQKLYNAQVARYAELEEKAWRDAAKYKKAYEAELKKGGNSGALNGYYRGWKQNEANAMAYRTSADAYKKGAKSILNPEKPIIETDNSIKGIKELREELKKLKQQRDEAANAGDLIKRDELNKDIKAVQAQIKAMQGNTSTTTSTKKIPTVDDFNLSMIKADIKMQQLKAAGEVVKEMPSVYEMMLPEIKKRILDKKDFDLGKDITQKSFGKKGNKTETSAEEKVIKDVSTITGAVGNIMSGIQSLGLELPEGVTQAIGMMQTISGILSAILAITTAINATQEVQTAVSFIPGLHTGGLLRAATGTVVPGNFGFDAVPSLLTSGELVLNKAQQNALASQLEDSGINGLHIVGELEGEKIILVANRTFRRKGEGEIVTWKS